MDIKEVYRKLVEIRKNIDQEQKIKKQDKFYMIKSINWDTEKDEDIIITNIELLNMLFAKIDGTIEYIERIKSIIPVENQNKIDKWE